MEYCLVELTCHSQPDLVGEDLLGANATASLGSFCLPFVPVLRSILHFEPLRTPTGRRNLVLDAEASLVQKFEV